MNIIVAINKAYITPLRTMLFSLNYNNSTIINVYLLHHELSHEDIAALSEFLNRNISAYLHEIRIDPSIFKHAPTQKWWSVEMYYRLLAFDFLPPSIDRALWLDADIIVNGSIVSFYDQELGDSYAVVCEGCDQTFNQRLGLPSDYRYFNSGVILFNIEKLRKDFSTLYILDLIEQYKDCLKAPDQDILNIMFKDNIVYADPEIYNNETFGDYVLTKEKMISILHKARIIHFNGAMKPWNPKGINWGDKLYWKYELKQKKYKEYISYRIQNFPMKLYAHFREFYYILLAVMKKIINLGGHTK